MTIPQFQWNGPEEVRDLIGKPVPAVKPENLPAEYDVLDGDRHIISCRQAPAHLAQDVVREYRAVPRASIQRGGGILTAGNAFGWAAPANVLQRVTPSLTGWSRDYPAQSLTAFADWAWAQLPVPQTTHGIHSDYRIGDTGWTSGSGNDTVPIHYHLDANNVPDAYSGMLCARAATDGGDLYFPGYRKAVPIRDQSLYMFQGVCHVHGVTPIKRRLPEGFRYTFVFYPVKAFAGKASLADEIAATQERRTELEATAIERHARAKADRDARSG